MKEIYADLTTDLVVQICSVLTPVGKSNFSEPVSAKTMVKANWFANIKASSTTLPDYALVTLTWNSLNTSTTSSSAGYLVYRSVGSPDNFTAIKYTSSVPMLSSFDNKLSLGTYTYTTKPETCKQCNGSGKIKCTSCNGTGKCNRCNGSGKL